MDTLSYKTLSSNKISADKKWFVVDAEGQNLGRFSSKIAKVLRGKYKTNFTPHADCGDNVVIINASKIVMTGNKLEKREIFSHTGYPGGIKETNPEKMKAKEKSNEIIKLAIKRMIPSGPLGKKQLSNCKIYSGEKHSHEAQQPKKIDFIHLNEKNFKR